jgi:phosphinothricin acetyltransferase
VTLRARSAAPADAPAIARIYNEGIADRVATFETRPRSADDIALWFGGKHPIVVVEDVFSLSGTERAGSAEQPSHSAMKHDSRDSSMDPAPAAQDKVRVIAFAATSSYRPRDCYAGIGEFSVYVSRDARGRGAGKLAMQTLIDAAREAGFWKLVSRVFIENDASRALLRSIGFREVGVYVKHAQLDGVWRDVVIVECLLQ